MQRPAAYDACRRRASGLCHYQAHRDGLRARRRRAAVVVQANNVKSCMARPQSDWDWGVAARQEAAADETQDERRRALAPALVPQPTLGVVGGSKYAARLRAQVGAAARDPTRGAVVVVGGPGMGAARIASLVHYGSRARHELIGAVDCATGPYGDALLARVFGRGGAPGLLHWLGGGALLVDNAHLAPAGLLARLRLLAERGTYTPLPGAAGAQCQGGCGGGGGKSGGCPVAEPAPRASAARVLVASASPLPELAASARVTTLTVPPLRARTADAAALQRLLVKRAARAAGCPAPQLLADAERHFKAYGFPGGEDELAAAVAFAMAAQVPAAAAAAAEPHVPRLPRPGDGDGAVVRPPGRLALGAAAFQRGVGRAQDAGRADLLAAAPWLRAALRALRWPEGVNHGFIKWAFAGVVAGLLLGPEGRGDNVFLQSVWCWWWPALFIAYPFVGRMWCSVCPFMVVGEAAQRWRAARGAALRKQPREALEAYGGWAMTALFFGILVWEEAWALPQHAALTAALLLLITAGATACSVLFEKRAWCSYLCPIGGMNGLFAKGAMTEVRGRQGVCAAECPTYACVKAPTQAEGACPVGLHPAQLVDNAACVMCLSCAAVSCPTGSARLLLRPPGVDLWTTHTPHAHEVALLLVLLGAAYLHRLPALCAALGLPPGLLDERAPHVLAAALVLALPGAAAWLAGAAGRAAAGAADAGAARDGGGGQGGAAWVRLAYGYVPLVWAATLSAYEPNLMFEAGTALQVAARTAGFDADAAAALPAIAAGADAVTFAQGGTLLLGCALSLALTRKLAALAGGRGFGPQALMIAAFTAGLWSFTFSAAG